eukprot:1331556-Pyramimonas_sp.AAC.1
MASQCIPGVSSARQGSAGNQALQRIAGFTRASQRLAGLRKAQQGFAGLSRQQSPAENIKA